MSPFVNWVGWAGQRTTDRDLTDQIKPQDLMSKMATMFTSVIMQIPKRLEGLHDSYVHTTQGQHNRFSLKQVFIQHKANITVKPGCQVRMNSDLRPDLHIE